MFCSKMPIKHKYDSYCMSVWFDDPDIEMPLKWIGSIPGFFAISTPGNET